MLFDGQRHLIESSQRPQAGDHSFSLSVLHKSFYILPGHQSSGNKVLRNRVSGKNVEQLEENGPSDTFEESALSLLLHAKDNIGLGRL